MNESLAKEKGLIIDNNKDIYMVLSNIYKYFFEKYLLENVNLSFYNEQIKNSELDFGIPKPTKKQLVSNLNEYLGLEYIYILNSFFVEKLNDEQIQILKKCGIEHRFEFTEEIRNLISITYKNVINNNFHKGNYVSEKYKVCYGVAIPSNFALNDELVIKIYYSKNKVKLDKEEFIENQKRKNNFIDELVRNLKNDIEYKLGIGCSVIIEKIPN